MFVQAGAQAPERLRVNVTNAERAPEPLDFTTVTAASFVVTQPSGNRVVWSADISGQTADLLILEHTFALNDVIVAGSYKIDINLSVPGGVRRAGPTALKVIE